MPNINKHFCYCSECLTNAIRKNTRIRGISIGNKQCKVSQYTNNTCFYLSDIDLIKMAFIVLELFTKSSGLKVNRDKSEPIGIENSSNFKHKTLEITWPVDSGKTLGILITTWTK